MPISGTGAFHYRYMVFIDKADHIRLVHIHQGPDYGNSRSVQISDGGEGVEASLENQ